MLETLQTNLNKRDKFQSKKTTPCSSFAVSDDTQIAIYFSQTSLLWILIHHKGHTRHLFLEHHKIWKAPAVLAATGLTLICVPLELVENQTDPHN